MKRIFASILVALVLISVPGNQAFAFNNAENSIVDELLYPAARELDLPTSFYDLKESDYNASLVVVGEAWLYTNYYFSPSARGKIYVSYNVENVPGWQFYIGVYDITDKKFVEEREVADLDAESMNTVGYSSGDEVFSGLKSNHYYAVAFKIDNKWPSSNTTSGTATVGI